MKVSTINLASIGIGVVGVYFIYDYGKKQGWFEKKKTSTPPIKPSNTKTVGEGSIPDKKQPTTPTNIGVVKNPTHIVNTKSGTLNIRQATNATSKIVGTLAKGQQIVASQTSTVGWHRLLNDKGLLIGYVSSDYIKAI